MVLPDNDAPRPKAYSYLRFSTPEQAQGDIHRIGQSPLGGGSYG